MRVTTLHNDAQLRNAAFKWLGQKLDQFGDVLPFTLLAKGFEFNDRQITFMNMPGIWRPRGFDVPLSIRTGSDSPYDDKNYDDGTLIYSYRGTNPNHQDNVGLREAMKNRTPLIYFKTISKGQYLVYFPVFIVDDDPRSLFFMVDLSPAILQSFPELANTGGDPEYDNSEAFILQKKYALATYERRVHQAQFRERVLSAYHCQCAMCRLKHRNLLDAAHILSDKHEKGDPVVSNGMALCKIHHAAYDQNILGVSPDYIIDVREDILAEVDGPMLRYGLQDMKGEHIQVPRSINLRPDRDHLAERYEIFQSAG